MRPVEAVTSKQSASLLSCHPVFEIYCMYFTRISKSPVETTAFESCGLQKQGQQCHSNKPTRKWKLHFLRCFFSPQFSEAFLTDLLFFFTEWQPKKAFRACKRKMMGFWVLVYSRESKWTVFRLFLCVSQEHSWVKFNYVFSEKKNLLCSKIW